MSQIPQPTTVTITKPRRRWLVQDALPYRILQVLRKAKEPYSTAQVAFKAHGDTASVAVALANLRKRGHVVRLGRSQYVAAGMEPRIKDVND